MPISVAGAGLQTSDNMAGRPSKYTPEAVQAICECLERGETRKAACAKAGIDVKTMERWLADNVDFVAVVKNAEDAYRNWEHNEILNSARKSLRILIEGTEYEETTVEYEQDPADPSKPRVRRQTTKTKKILPNPTAVIFALCNRDPENWKNRINQEVEGKIQTEQKQEVSLANLSDELLEEVIKSIRGEE